MADSLTDSASQRLNVRTVSFLARPYAIPADLQSAITTVELRVYPDGEVFEGGPSRHPQRVIVNKDDAERSTFDLSIELDESNIRSGAKELGLSLDDLALVVLTRNTRLRQEQVVLQEDVASMGSLRLKVCLTESVPWMRASAGLATMDIAVYLVTLREVDVSGSLMRKGTWLASRSFQVTSDSEAFEFDPSPLTEEDAKREGIPLTTLVYVTYQDPDAEGVLHREVSAKDAIVVYVNKSLLERLVSTTSIQARNIVALLIKQEALQQLVTLIAIEASQVQSLPGLQSMLEDKTIAGRIVRLIARSKDIEADESWLYQLIVDNPARAQAYCYAAAESSQLLQSYIGLD